MQLSNGGSGFGCLILDTPSGSSVWGVCDYFNLETATGESALVSDLGCTISDTIGAIGSDICDLGYLRSTTPRGKWALVSAICVA